MADFGAGSDGSDKIIRDVVRIRSKETDPADARDFGGALKEDVEGWVSVEVFAVGVDVLAEESDFDTAGVDELAEFGENVVKGTRDLRAAREGNDAIGAEIGATTHDFDVGVPRVWAASDAFVEGFGNIRTDDAVGFSGGDGGEERWQCRAQTFEVSGVVAGNMRLSNAALERGEEEGRDAVAGVGAADEVYVWIFLKNALAGQFGHAAADAENKLRAARAGVAELPQFPKDFAFGKIADAARVENDCIGF